MNLRNSAFDCACLANPSTRFAQTDFDGPADLIRQGPLFQVRERQADPMHLQGEAIRPLEHLQAFKRDRFPGRLIRLRLFSDI